MIAYRHAIPADRRFIVSGWSSSYRLSLTAGMIAMDDWADVMHPQIEKVLRRPDCETIVAYETDDPGSGAQHYGFISADRSGTIPLLFYVYVKQAYRRGKTLGMAIGIGRGLFRAAGIDPSAPLEYTYKTIAATELSRKIPLAKWRPLKARFSKDSPKPKEHDHGR